MPVPLAPRSSQPLPVGCVTRTFPARRRRRPVKKSSSGCKTCKERKIKCDETAPCCLRCLEKGKDCPGYQKQLKLRWSQKHELHSSTCDEESEKQSTPNGKDTETTPSPSPSLSGQSSTSTGGNDISIVFADAVIDSQPLNDSPDDIYSHEGLGELEDAVEQSLASLILDQTRALDLGAFGHDPGQPGDLINTVDLDIPWTTGQQTFHGSGFDSSYQVHEMVMVPSTFLKDTPGGPSATPVLGSEKISRSGSPERSTPCQRNAPLMAGIVDLQGNLIDAYFNTVCRIFSVFDSPQNLFRSYVSRKWQSSGAMFYAMLSMASAKLGRQSWTYKKHASEYQSLAIEQLSEALSAASSWTPELLIVVLMLGLSTAWHDVSDLGLVHLKALQNAVLKSTITCSEDELETLDFFKKALIYWEMVTSCVTEDITVHDYTGLISCCPEKSAPPRSNQFGFERLKPHPWGSIAQKPQALFTRLVRLFRQLRSFDQSSTNPRSQLTDPAVFLDAVEALENELWRCELPGLHEIANTGDARTPPIHHLLLAEAYMLANFYQLYQTFPNLLAKRGRHIDHMDGSSSQMQSLTMVSSSLPHSGATSEDWLKFLGRSIIIRLDQIHVSSGTSCVHPLLLLVGSTSLSFTPDMRGSEEEVEILRMRESVLSRMSLISHACLSEPIHTVELAVREIFKRLDVGVKVFWMDMLQNMGLVTIIG